MYRFFLEHSKFRKQNRRRKCRTYICKCTVKPYDILEVKNALPKFCVPQHKAQQSCLFCGFQSICLQHAAHICKLYIHSFIHSAVYLTTSPQPSPKPFLHTGRSSVSSFNVQYSPFSLKSSRRCLHLHPCLPIASIFPSIMCFRRHFPRKM